MAAEYRTKHGFSHPVVGCKELLPAQDEGTRDKDNSESAGDFWGEGPRYAPHLLCVIIHQSSSEEKAWAWIQISNPTLPHVHRNTENDGVHKLTDSWEWFARRLIF